MALAIQAEKLSAVRQSIILLAQGREANLCPQMNENQKLLKKDNKRELRRKRRQLCKLNSLRCFKCRKFGHRLADCPAISVETENFNICFKCGSTEHTSLNCKSIIKGEKEFYPYAQCFVCGKNGHLSKNCSLNKNGIYPNGGSCMYCGKNDHLKRDCPNTNIQLPKIVIDTPHVSKFKKTVKKKVIKF